MSNYDEYPLNDACHWQWHTTFIGQTMQHNYRVYYILDEVFALSPNVRRIVEIGTGCGALTTYLALWGLKRDIPLLTLDQNTAYYDKNVLSKLQVNILTGDEFDPEIIAKIKTFVNDEPTLFVCDGGAKQREFDLWAMELPVGSVIMAHDFTVEFGIPQIKPEALNRCTPFLEHRWLEMNAQMAIFKITD